MQDFLLEIFLGNRAAQILDKSCRTGDTVNTPRRTGDPANGAWLAALFYFFTLIVIRHAAAATEMQVTDLQNYRVQSFTTDGGLSVDSLLHITRLQDGRVVIVGTRGEPVLFDGVRFAKPTITSGQRIDTESGARMSLQTPDGALWFASQKAGLLRLKGGELRQLSDIETATLALSRDQKRVLVGTRTQVLEFDVQQPASTRPVKARLLATPGMIVLALLESADGATWIATSDGLFVLPKNATSAQRFAEPRLAHAHIWALHQDASGRLLIGTRGLGLAILASTKIDAPVHFVGLEQGLPHLVIRSITESGGAIWLATAGGGVARMLGDKIEVFDRQNGLTSDTTTWITADFGGVIWVATAGAGLNRLWPSPFRKITDLNGRSGGFFYAVHSDPRGTLWIGSNRGLSRVFNAQLVKTWVPGEGQSGTVLSIVDDQMPMSAPSDVLLLTTRRGVVRFYINEERFEPVAGAQDFPLARLFAPKLLPHFRAEPTENAPNMALDADAQNFEYPLLAQQNQLYAITKASLIPILALPSGAVITDIERRIDQPVLIASTVGLFQFDGTTVRPLGEPLRADTLLALAGRTIVGGAGLSYVDNSGFHALGFAGALAGENVVGYRSALRQVGSMISENDNVWITTGNGLYRMQREILARATSEILLPAPQQFMLAAGLESTEFEAAPQGTLIHDSKVWLASTGGVAVLDPALALLVPIKMTLSMRGVEAEEDEFTPELGAILLPKILPAGTRRVRLRFAALPASHAQSVTISYRLLPVETQFRSDLGQREAVYAALAPGEYQFELRAAVPGSQLNSVPLSYHFSIAPKPIERKSVQAALILGSLLLLSALPILHIFGLRRQKRRLTDEVSEKTKALELLARTDSLTQLANRRFFDEHVQMMLTARSPNEKQPGEQRLGGMLLMDIDYFKRYNDTYGHQAGDACLRAVSACLAQFSKQHQLFAARIGGEEFALLVQHSTAVDLTQQLAQLAAQVCTRVRSLEIAHITSELGFVTISVGAALAESLDLADTLIQRCDAALYQAKAAGRDGWKLAERVNLTGVSVDN